MAGRNRWLKRCRHWLRAQAKLEIVVPVVVSAGLLGYVMSVAIAPKSASQLWSVLQQTFVVIIILTFVYLAARVAVWRQLLIQLGFKIPWRQLLASFAAGEMTKSVPAGVYAQNYVLSRMNRFNRVSAVRSGMATTALLGLESLIAVPIALIFGVPGNPWVRWTIVGVVAAWVVILLLAYFLAHRFEAGLSRERHPRLQQAAHLAAEFLEAGAELVSWRTLSALLPTAIYMLVYVVDLDLILHALGVHGISFLQVMNVYAVTILAVILVPIPTEIGITEISGLSLLQAYGVAGSTAAIAMLSLRLLATGLTILVAGILLFVLRDELDADERAPQSAAGETAPAPH